MTQRDNILQELEALESLLATASFADVYQVPAGYFEQLPGQLLQRIRAMETTDVQEEISILSPLINKAGKVLPYKVPAGYFNNVEERLGLVMQSPQEELEQLSPLLSGLSKQLPYSVPKGYFDSTIHTGSRNDTPAKIVPMVRRTWFRYAAAAVIIAIVSVSGFFALNKQQTNDPGESYTWVQKNMNKVSTEELNEFITITDYEEAPVIAASGETEVVKDLIKNISDKEIQDFLNDTEVLETSDDGVLN
jgi:hypothetical protein